MTDLAPDMPVPAPAPVSAPAGAGADALGSVPALSPDFDPLLLQNQLCFPLYACAKEIVRRYSPFLDDLDLTYTQYICMMALWEQEGLSVHELGGRLHLDSGTLTPLLKRLEASGYVSRERSTADERRVEVRLTEAGRALRERALCVPGQLACGLPLTPEEGSTLAKMLWELLERMSHQTAEGEE